MYCVTRSGAVRIVIAGALVLGLSACQDSDPVEGPASTSTDIVSEPPTDAAGSVNPTENAKAERVADAKQRYEKFVAISNKHAKKGTDAYGEYIAGGFLGNEKVMNEEGSYWKDFASQDLVQSGDVRVLTLEVTEYEGDPTQKSILGQRVHMRACVDTSEVDVLNADGASVRQEGEPERKIMNVVMQGQSKAWSVSENTGVGEVC